MITAVWLQLYYKEYKADQPNKETYKGKVWKDPECRRLCPLSTESGHVTFLAYWRVPQLGSYTELPVHSIDWYLFMWTWLTESQTMWFNWIPSSPPSKTTKIFEKFCFRKKKKMHAWKRKYLKIKRHDWEEDNDKPSSIFSKKESYFLLVLPMHHSY